MADLPVTATSSNFTCTEPAFLGSLADSTLSAGSATFILVALFLGCITQPSGSFIFAGCDRLWRLHPVFSFVEALVIFSRLVIARVHGTSLRVTSHVLLAERLGNSCQKNLWSKQQKLVSAPTKDDIDGLFREVENMERGSTLRPAVILPMVLQFLKLCFIRGDPLLTVVGMFYFLSWLSVEVLLLQIHGNVLDEVELLEAYEELLLSVCPTIIISNNSASEESAEVLLHHAEVTRQSDALLSEFVTDSNRRSPRLHVRKYGKPILRGDASTWATQRTIGVALWVMDSSFAPGMYLMVFGDGLLPFWLILTIVIVISCGGGILFDSCIGAVLRKVWVLWDESNKVLLDEQLTVSWLASRAVLPYLSYYILFYYSAGTYKPAWLDWLG